LKHLQDAVGSTLEQTGIRNNLLNRTQKAQHLRETMNKWDCMKLKSFCTAKEPVTRLKRQPTEEKKIFASYSSDKELISRVFWGQKNSAPKNQHLNEEMGTLIKRGILKGRDTNGQ
jgi:hypothetical protein